MKHFGHIIRHNILEKTIIQGITAGKRGRGRPARTWEKDIEEWAGTNIGEATRMAERRDLWCTVNIEPSEQREREREMQNTLGRSVWRSSSGGYRYRYCRYPVGT